MKWLKIDLIWEGLPFLIFLSVLALVYVFNWNYESKLFFPDHTGSDWVEMHMGQLLLLIAMGQTTIASFLLFLVRITGIKVKLRNFAFIPMVIVAVFFIFPSLLIIVLGPASITMAQQMRVEQR